MLDQAVQPLLLDQAVQHDKLRLLSIIYNADQINLILPEGTHADHTHCDTQNLNLKIIYYNEDC